MQVVKAHMVHGAVDERPEVSARELAQVLEQSGEAVIVKDLNAVVTYWNREATSLYGFSAEEAIGQPLRKLHAADLSDADYSRLQERVLAGRPTSSTTERRKKSGEIIRVTLKTTPLLDDQGNLIGEITNARDVTAMYLKEEALRGAKDAADAALRANETITGELRAAQSELMTNARQAGMAEIANNVLHNVGNVLNSVNVSVGLIGNRLRESKSQGLADVVRLMNEHVADIGEFLTRDARGQRVLGYLNKLAMALATERRSLVEELELLAKSVDHIKEIVATQQSYAGAASIVEPVQMGELVQDALRMTSASMERHQVTVITHVASVPTLLMDKHLMLQILINLISNAKQAMDGVPDGLHQVTLRVDEARAADERSLRVRVEDNGEGIDAANLPKLFQHGFTTRTNGHGFGLHSCALAVQGMGGTLSADSEGRGRGASFTLQVPMKIAAVP
jgi:two-component system, NtrC family, sensor kinase